MWRIRQFFACLKDEKGIGVVEVILILVGIFTPYLVCYPSRGQ